MARDFHLPDPRFFETLSPASVGELATLTGARLERGDRDLLIARVASLERAGTDAIVFLTDRRHIAAVEKLFQGSASFL